MSTARRDSRSSIAWPLGFSTSTSVSIPSRRIVNLTHHFARRPLLRVPRLPDPLDHRLDVVRTAEVLARRAERHRCRRPLCEAAERNRRAACLDPRVARLDLRTGGRLARMKTCLRVSQQASPWSSASPRGPVRSSPALWAPAACRAAASHPAAPRFELDDPNGCHSARVPARGSRRARSSSRAGSGPLDDRQ